MKKTAIAVFVCAAMLLTAVGCGSGTNAVFYALVTNSQGLADKEVSEIWIGIESYASGLGKTAGRYTAKDVEEASVTDAIKNAADSGAVTIVCKGTDMETPVYKAQKTYDKIHFILIGGEPREKADAASSIAENTICITYQEAQAAFLAGYGSVTEGRRSLAFMAGVKSEDAVEYEAGFVSGIVAAAEDLNLDAGSVSVKVSYAGSDELTPVRMEAALKLYDGGCEEIMTYGDNIRKAVVKAAALRGKYVISAGCDARAESDRITMGTITDSGNAVTAALAQCDETDFKGGTSVMYGVKEGSVALAIDFSKFTNFTQEICDAETDKLSSGTVVVPDTEQTSGSTQVSVDVLSGE